MILIGFLFYRSHGVVGRPGFRIGNRTIKRGSHVTFSVSVVERSNLCIIGIILSWFLFDSYRSEILVLVVIVMTSLSPSKTIFGCIFYCIFCGGDFADSLVRKCSHLPTHTKISIAYS